MTGAEYDELQSRIAKLRMSPTFSAITTIAHQSPFDPNDKEVTANILKVHLLSVVDEIDNGNIKHQGYDSWSALIGLLSTVLTITFDGDVPVEEVKAQ